MKLIPSLGIKTKKAKPKAILMDVMRGMMREIAPIRKEWKDRKNWRQKKWRNLNGCMKM